MIRSQGYDCAANMAGVGRGVQAWIRQQIHGAIYMHCKGHNVFLLVYMPWVFGEKHDGHTPTDRLLLQLLS